MSTTALINIAFSYHHGFSLCTSLMGTQNSSDLSSCLATNIQFLSGLSAFVLILLLKDILLCSISLFRLLFKSLFSFWLKKVVRSIFIFPKCLKKMVIILFTIPRQYSGIHIILIFFLMPFSVFFLFPRFLLLIHAHALTLNLHSSRNPQKLPSLNGFFMSQQTASRTRRRIRLDLAIAPFSQALPL